MNEDVALAGRARLSEGNIHLSRAELLLSAAEAACAAASGTPFESAWHAATQKLLSGAATFRNATAASALALVAEAKQMQARVAAEAAALRGEVEMLRGERDLYLSLAVEAGGAVARNLNRWQQLHDGIALIDASPPTFVEDAATRPGGEPDLLPDFPAGRLSGVEIGADAVQPVSVLQLSVAAPPQLASLLDLERAIAALPSVSQCAVTGIGRDSAELELIMRPPMAPLVVAAEILSAADCPISIARVSRERISAVY